MMWRNTCKQKKHYVTLINSNVCQEKVDTELLLRTHKFPYYYIVQGYILIRNNYHIIILALLD